jgi:hypothetical protein
MLSEAKHLLPHPVLPSDSEAFLTSFGMASPGRLLAVARGDKERGLGTTTSLPVFPRCVSAEGPLASLGETKKEDIGARWGRIAPCFARDNKMEGLPGHEGSLA